MLFDALQTLLFNSNIVGAHIVLIEIDIIQNKDGDERICVVITKSVFAI